MNFWETRYFRTIASWKFCERAPLFFRGRKKCFGGRKLGHNKDFFRTKQSFLVSCTPLSPITSQLLIKCTSIIITKIPPKSANNANRPWASRLELKRLHSSENTNYLQQGANQIYLWCLYLVKWFQQINPRNELIVFSILRENISGINSGPGGDFEMIREFLR